MDDLLEFSFMATIVVFVLVAVFHLFSLVLG